MPSVDNLDDDKRCKELPAETRAAYLGANGKICPLPSPVSLTKPANRVTSAGLATLTSEFVRRAPACLRKPAVLSPSTGSRALTGTRFSKSLVHND